MAEENLREAYTKNHEIFLLYAQARVMLMKQFFSVMALMIAALGWVCQNAKFHPMLPYLMTAMGVICLIMVGYNEAVTIALNNTDRIGAKLEAEMNQEGVYRSFQEWYPGASSIWTFGFIGRWCFGLLGLIWLSGAYLAYHNPGAIAALTTTP